MSITKICVFPKLSVMLSYCELCLSKQGNQEPTPMTTFILRCCPTTSPEALFKEQRPWRQKKQTTLWGGKNYNENFTFSWFPFIKLTVFLLTFIQSWKLSEEEIISLLALCFPIVNLTSSCPFSFGLDIYIVLWNLNKILYLPREPLLNILIDVC